MDGANTSIGKPRIKNIKKDKSVVAKYRTRWGIGGNRETRTIEIWKIRLLQPAD